MNNKMIIDNEIYKDKKLVQTILDIGAFMMKCGAECSRVEDSLFRMCKSYGFERYDIFALPSNIQITIELNKGNIHTQIRNIEHISNDFSTLNKLNALSRYACENKPDASELNNRFIDIIEASEDRMIFRYLGGIMGGSGFTIFFGGGAWDAIASSIVSILIIFLSSKFSEDESNPMIYNFGLAFISELAIILLSVLKIARNPGAVTIGIVMLMVSGIGVINGMRDMINKDIMSGMINVVNAVLGAAGIASGIAISFLLMKGVI